MSPTYRVTINQTVDVDAENESAARMLACDELDEDEYEVEELEGDEEDEDDEEE